MSHTDLEQIRSRIEEYRTEMVSSLSALISIPSIAVRTKGPDPFGAPVQQAYEAMLRMGADAGFRTFDADHFGGHIDFEGAGEGIFGIVGHLDVVPEGDGWDFDPYGGEVIDGFVCGRGTMDDKGPVIAAFYAMKALRDCGFIPKKTVRMILGLDEETEWEGMRHYLAFAEDTPDSGFTPDADFPVIHGEMGILVFDIARKFGRTQNKGLQLRSVRGGTAANSVADSARAVVYRDDGGGYEDIRNIISALRESTGWKIHTKGIGKSLEIRTAGQAAHGAKPGQGLNAISILMNVFSYLNFASDDVTEFIRFYNDHIGFDLHGERIGCAMEDELSGPLVWNVGMIDLDPGSVRLTINVRYPVTAEDVQVYEGITRIIAPFDLGIIKGKHQPPIYIPADDPMIVTLMDIYRRATGDEQSQPLVIGGGTYARAMDGIVAFGARFPGGPELGHQKNEKISVDDLVLLAKIYAEAIAALAGEASGDEASGGEAPGNEASGDEAGAAKED
ncbi:MAG: dipeptidase PepV [Firmicutes bacterium]|nr:dipeptidase PepV [Bacillota bacterium]